MEEGWNEDSQKELFAAMEDDCWERRYYFDIEVERVVCVTEQVRGKLQAIYDEQGEALDRLPTLELQSAHEVEMDDARFLRMPAVDGAEKLLQCDRFAESADPPLQKLLYTALDHQDLIGFERILKMEPLEQKRWQMMWESYLEKKFQMWLTQQ